MSVPALQEVLLEVVEGVMLRPIGDVIAGLYYMPTIRANVFVCCAVPGEHASKS